MNRGRNRSNLIKVLVEVLTAGGYIPVYASGSEDLTEFYLPSEPIHCCPLVVLAVSTTELGKTGEPPGAQFHQLKRSPGAQGQLGQHAKTVCVC